MDGVWNLIDFKYFSFSFFCLFPSNRFLGSLKYYPEVSGLSNREIKDLQSDIVGERILIDTNRIDILDVSLNGKISFDIDSVKIIAKVPDSLSIFRRFFCQELIYLNGITKETIFFLDQTYNKDSVAIIKFRCDKDNTFNCATICILSPSLSQVYNL